MASRLRERAARIAAKRSTLLKGVPPAPSAPADASALALTPLEHWRFAEEHDMARSAVSLRFAMVGGLDRSHLDEALREALTQHPLLTARINGPASEPTAKLAWQPLEHDSWPEPRWLAAGEEPPAVAIDPTKAAALAVFARDDGDAVAIWLTAHPAACDAHGLAQLAYDLLQAAAGLVEPATNGASSARAPASRRHQPKREAALLAKRGDLHLSAAEWKARLLTDIGAAWRWARAPGNPLLASSQAAAQAQVQATSRSWLYTFDEQQAISIGRGARHEGYRLIELCQREWLVTLAEAATTASAGDKLPADAVLRLGCAVDLRRLGDEKMPAAPLSGWLPIELKLADLAAMEVAADEAMQRYQSEQDAGAALAPVHLAHLFGRFPGGMLKLTEAPLARGGWGAAALFALDPALAAGSVPTGGAARWRAGGFEVRDLRLLPALRRGTPLAIAVTPYAGKLNIVLRHDPDLVPVVRAAALLAALVARLKEAMLGAEAAERDFEELLAEAAAHRPQTSLWSLPLGKRMATSPVVPSLPTALPPAAASEKPAAKLEG